MGKHFSHLTPTQRTQIDAFRRAGMKVVDIAKEVGVHYTTIYRELKRCTYEHLNSDYTTEIRYNPDGAQARYEANLRAKGPELKIGNDYELADYLIGKIRDEKYSPEAAIGEAEVGCTSAQVRPTTTSGARSSATISLWKCYRSTGSAAGSRSGQRAPSRESRQERA